MCGLEGAGVKGVQRHTGNGFSGRRKNGGDAHMALESEEMVVPFHLFLPFLRFQSCLETSRSL